jgi:hypothetical protein
MPGELSKCLENISIAVTHCMVHDYKNYRDTDVHQKAWYNPVYLKIRVKLAWTLPILKKGT